MFGLRNAIIFSTLLTSTFAAPSQQHQHNDESIVDWTHLSSLLDNIPDNVLHNVLHNLSPKFRDGVFSKDRAAIEHVHSENPVMASKLVYIAKRQNNGTTTAGVAPVPTTSDSNNDDDSSTSARASTTPTTYAPVAATVSDAVSEIITSSNLPSNFETSITVAPSTAPNEVAVQTIDGGVVFSTEGGGLVTRTSSAIGVRFTASTSTHTYYSTDANGQVSTSTSLVVVNAPVTETANPTGAAGAAATSGDAGLQNAGSRTSSPDGLFLGMVGATFVGIMALAFAL